MMRQAVSAFEGWQIVEFRKKLELLVLEYGMYHHRGLRSPSSTGAKKRRSMSHPDILTPKSGHVSRIVALRIKKVSPTFGPLMSLL